MTGSRGAAVVMPAAPYSFSAEIEQIFSAEIEQICSHRPTFSQPIVAG
jgi:hypothetical protein